MRRSQAAPGRGSVTSNDGVRLATLDYHGNGPGLVLLHGLGPNQRSMSRLAAALTPAFRVVTYDQRCVGESESGQWTFEAAVEDVQAVVDGHRMDNPVVVGHSLGGMIALMYAATRPEVPGVVNIDGWGPGRPELYIGEDPEVVREVLRRISSLKPDSRVGRAAIALLERRASVKRAKDMRDQALAAVWELDMLTLHREASCRVLAFNCTAPPAAGTRLMLGEEAVRVLNAQRRGLRLALDELCASRPNISVVEVDASHMSMARRPELFAPHIREFAR